MGKMLKALIVDDSQLICWGLATVLSRESCHVTTVYNGKDALAEVAGDIYDMVFLDANLPDINWLDVLAGLRKASPGAEIVIMTRDARGDNRKQAMEKGAFRFLEKPFTLGDIHVIVKEMSTACVKWRERVTL